jgi:hypothetical protein
MPAWGFEKVRRCIFSDRRVEVVLVLLFLLLLNAFRCKSCPLSFSVPDHVMRLMNET